MGDWPASPTPRNLPDAGITVTIPPSEIIKVTELGWGAIFEEYERLVLGPLKEQRKAAKAWRSALRKKSPE